MAMHPDVKKALEMLTRHARMAGASMHFKDMLGDEEQAGGENVPVPINIGEKPHGMPAPMPTPGKDLDEKVKETTLEMDAGHQYPYDHMGPTGAEDIYGDETGDADLDDVADEHVDERSGKLAPMHMAIMTTKSHMPMAVASKEPVKKPKGRSRSKF